jgi:hypothetical protein
MSNQFQGFVYDRFKKTGQLTKVFSKQAKQEGTKLKALELLGKSAGLFTQGDAEKPDVVTAEQLKRELGQHLKLVRERKASV